MSMAATKRGSCSQCMIVVLTLPALQILRQKRMYETQRETLYNQQFNMEQTRFTVESIQVWTLTSSLIAHA